MSCSFHHNNNIKRTSISPLTNIVKNSITKRNQALSHSKNEKTNGTSVMGKNTLGNRYIPLRESEEEWTSSWLNNGSSGVVFTDDLQDNNKTPKKNKEVLDLNGKEILNLVLRNEMLNENISSPIRHTDYSITHQPSLCINPKPKSFLTFGMGLLKENNRNSKRISHIPIPSCPFSQGTIDLLSMKLKYSLKITDTPLKIFQTKLNRNECGGSPLDWSSKNVLACSSGNSVYFKNYEQKTYFKYDAGYCYSVVKFNLSGEKMFLGCGEGSNRFIDILEDGVITRTVSRCYDDVTDATWFDDNVVAISTHSGYIILYDTRDFDKKPVTFYDCKCSINKILFNKSRRYLASARACNIVNIWCMRTKKYYETFDKHTDSVNSLAWSTYSENVLASGGACQRLYIRDINIPQNIKHIDTGHPINNIHWMKDTRNIITTHGFSTSDVVLWDSIKLNPTTIYASKQKAITHSVISPKGDILGTTSPKGSIFFWDLKKKSEERKDLHRSKLNPHYFVR